MGKNVKNGKVSSVSASLQGWDNLRLNPRKAIREASVSIRIAPYVHAPLCNPDAHTLGKLAGDRTPVATFPDGKVLTIADGYRFANNIVSKANRTGMVRRKDRNGKVYYSRPNRKYLSYNYSDILQDIASDWVVGETIIRKNSSVTIPPGMSNMGRLFHRHDVARNNARGYWKSTNYKYAGFGWSPLAEKTSRTERSENNRKGFIPKGSNEYVEVKSTLSAPLAYDPTDSETYATDIKRMRACLTTLTEAERTIVLHGAKRIPASETAKLLGVTTQYVWMNRQRTEAKLRTMFADMPTGMMRHLDASDMDSPRVLRTIGERTGTVYHRPWRAGCGTRAKPVPSEDGKPVRDSLRDYETEHYLEKLAKLGKALPIKPEGFRAKRVMVTYAPMGTTRTPMGTLIPA